MNDERDSDSNSWKPLSTDYDDRIAVILDFVASDNTPVTMAMLLEYAREESDLRESDVRDAARERDLLPPVDPARSSHTEADDR